MGVRTQVPLSLQIEPGRVVSKTVAPMFYSAYIHVEIPDTNLNETYTIKVENETGEVLFTGISGHALNRGFSMELRPRISKVKTDEND